MSWVDWLALGITSIGLLNCVAFCVVYWVTSHGAWLKDEAGQFMMLFFGSLGLVFLVVILNRILGNYPGRSAVGIGLYIVLVLATGWPMRLLFGAQKRRRIRDEQGHDTRA